MTTASPARSTCLLLPAAALLLVVLAGWLRWPTLGFSLWNVDEAIHAAAARTILDGGVIYRDAIDQRTPLTYYAVAGVFAIFGENNLWAVRALVALLVAGTGLMLLLAGRALGRTLAGGMAAGFYVLLATSVLYQGDANAANTEWFVAFFTSAAAAVFLAGGHEPSVRRLLASGALLAGAFLSKQPALLDLAAPTGALLYAGWSQSRPVRTILSRLALGAAGWLVPMLLTAAYLAAHGALDDGLFYAWTYNLAYYGAELSTADRLTALTGPLQLIGGAHPWLLALWVGGSGAAVHRLLQRDPTSDETRTNPGLVFVAVWSLASLGGAASSGRAFDHYTIQFLAPFCLGAGLVLARLAAWAGTADRHPAGRLLAGAGLAAILVDTIPTTLAARERTLPEDPSVRVSAHIRAHSAATDRIFVWGFHPDIYLHADRRPASRFLFASFLTGLIPWTNTQPDRDTGYAIVPGTMDQLLQDLAARPPVFIVDCSVGPNRHWQKYPLDKFPALQAFVRQNYVPEEPGRFVPQGFGLYRRRTPGESVPTDPDAPPLPVELAATLQLGTLGQGLAPHRASAPHGASLGQVEGRMEYFAHAPSALVYRIPAGATALRGGFGIKPAAYAAENPAATDGAEFIVRWRTPAGEARELLRRHLRPREEPGDRAVQSFWLPLPAHQGGELELIITPGPSGIPASDWTFWTDLLLENSR